jgi:hypothetical protein
MKNELITSHITVYGDESVNNNIVCYAICIIPTNLVESAENILKDLKKQFNIPENYFLHCKELFNGHERERLDFNISLENIRNLYTEIASKFKTANMICCYVDKREIKNEKEVIDWGKGGAKTEFYFGDKELIHWCKNGAMIDVVRSRKEDEYSFYPDPDNKSKMRWNGKRGKVNNQNYNVIVFADTINYENHQDQMIRVKQINITKEKPELIQIADFLAYSFAKAKTVQEYRDKDFFVKIIEILNPVSNAFCRIK